MIASSASMEQWSLTGGRQSSLAISVFLTLEACSSDMPLTCSVMKDEEAIAEPQPEEVKRQRVRLSGERAGSEKEEERERTEGLEPAEVGAREPEAKCQKRARGGGNAIVEETNTYTSEITPFSSTRIWSFITLQDAYAHTGKGETGRRETAALVSLVPGPKAD